METIEGIIQEIIYKNEENGYTVLIVETEEEDVTCVGTLFNIAVGEEIKAVGTYVSHNVYGMQFKINSFTTFIPRELKAMERYLASGAIKGIGPALAKRIFARFAEDTFRIIEQEPEKLVDIRGISEKKALEIAKTFHEQKSMRQTIIFLQEYGISLIFAIKIYNQYKERTIEVVKTNPYQLAEDIYGIGFKMADMVADRVGVDKLSSGRMMSGIKYVLTKATLDGHVFVSKEKLIDYSSELLGIDVTNIENSLIHLQIANQIKVVEKNGEEVIYLLQYYNMEQYVAGKICDLASVHIEEDKKINDEIDRIEDEQGLFFDAYQKQAIIDSMNHGVLVITGGPGTGKTTTINAIIEALTDRDLEVFLAAPTGRAAKRMTETTGIEAKTIHRLLEVSSSTEDVRQRFERNEGYPLECDVLIIDECSMVDISLMYHLLKAVVEGTRLILVGDKDQLPSVGPGNVLKDIIHSEFVGTVTLKKIFRQAQESDIVINAHKINAGEQIVLKGLNKDFFFIRRNNGDQIIEEIVSLIKTRLPKFTGESSSEGIQVLTPMRKGLLGTENLNIQLQNALNPHNKSKKEKVYRKNTFREGDKVMQIRNNYNIKWEIVGSYKYVTDEGTGVFNGDVGRILKIDHFSEKVTVKFDDDKQVEYDFTNLDELELAYSVTIHKSQGSEYPVVIIPIFQGPPMLLTRNLLYTAITRAKRYVVILGSEDTLKKMIDNNREVNRNTMLSESIDNAFYNQQ